METRQRGGKAFVVARQTAKTGEPDEGVLHYPTPGQQPEATLGLGELDHFQFYAVLGRRVGGFLAV